MNPFASNSALPPEIWNKILIKVPVTDLPQLSSVDKNLNTLVKKIPYIIENESYGKTNQDKNYKIEKAKQELWSNGYIGKCVHQIKFGGIITQKIAYFVSIIFHFFKAGKKFDKIKKDFEKKIHIIFRNIQEVRQKQIAFEYICNLFGGEQEYDKLPLLSLGADPDLSSWLKGTNIPSSPIMRGKDSEGKRFVLFHSSSKNIWSYFHELDPLDIDWGLDKNHERIIERRGLNWCLVQVGRCLFEDVPFSLFTYTKEKNIIFKRREHIKEKIEELKNSSPKL